MDEAVLVLCLHHVVPLRAHQGHVTVDVYGALVPNALQHAVDDDKTASAADSGANGGRAVSEMEDYLCSTHISVSWQVVMQQCFMHPLSFQSIQSLIYDYRL